MGQLGNRTAITEDTTTSRKAFAARKKAFRFLDGNHFQANIADWKAWKEWRGGRASEKWHNGGVANDQWTSANDE